MFALFSQYPHPQEVIALTQNAMILLLFYQDLVEVLNSVDGVESGAS